MVPRCLRASVVVLGFVAVSAAACGGADERVPPVVDAATDAPIDSPIDGSAFCSTCGPDQICVQVFGGTCGQIALSCVPRNPACVGNGCTAECMRWHCNDGNQQQFFRCDKGSCPGAAPGALICRGP